MEGKLQKGIPHNSQSPVAANYSTLVEEVANARATSSSSMARFKIMGQAGFTSPPISAN